MNQCLLKKDYGYSQYNKLKKKNGPRVFVLQICVWSKPTTYWYTSNLGTAVVEFITVGLESFCFLLICNKTIAPALDLPYVLLITCTLRITVQCALCNIIIANHGFESASYRWESPVGNIGVSKSCQRVLTPVLHFAMLVNIPPLGRWP